MFRHCETANIRPHVSEIYKSIYSCTLNSKEYTTSLGLFLKCGADDGCLVHPKYDAF
jgi:hypothetical protein